MPMIIQAFIPDGAFKDLQVVLLCPATDCQTLYIARYRVLQSPPFDSLCTLRQVHLLQFAKMREFSNHITELSPAFCSIYNDSEKAEENGLTHICGVGYRRALEFLIKDFLIGYKLKDNTEDQETVRSSPLMSCIRTYIDNPRLKAAAERAAWLGNDETHYVRKWADKDLRDLKALIKITVSWIEMELETDKYELEMAPNGNKG